MGSSTPSIRWKSCRSAVRSFQNKAEFSFEIRHLVYFSHRIIFRVDPTAKRVIVYRVYHGFQRQTLLDLQEAMMQLIRSAGATHFQEVAAFRKDGK